MTNIAVQSCDAATKFTPIAPDRIGTVRDGKRGVMNALHRFRLAAESASDLEALLLADSLEAQLAGLNGY